MVRLTLKLAEVVDGVDLSHCTEGDVVELSDSDARLLIIEGWAEPVAGEERVRRVVGRVERAVAADRPPKKRNA